MDRLSTVNAALDAATRTLAQGDAAQAERAAKAISAIARAEQDLAAWRASAAPSMEDDEEARRAELRRRIARLVEAERDRETDPLVERDGPSGPAE